MSSPQTLTSPQLDSARLSRWHQQTAPGTQLAEGPPSENANGGAQAHRLLTLDVCRTFVEQAGLLLFVPRIQLASAPAPSLVEAILGRSEASPSVAETAEARRIVASLVADGSAVVLNLLGAPGTTPEAPDFIVSAAIFPYVFTLRGDKLWKQPPAISGPLKVSPLAANIVGLLANRQARTASDLALELGKGVTEAATLRALGELWQHLRVLPVPQVDGSPALWEMATDRFTKQIKAGANAGQPTALSALASVYLGQALLATEEEIATFLSPLASGSRVHDVLHALTAGQQLESLVVNGKQCLHVAKELPHFPELSTQLAAQESPSTAEGTSDPETSRIRRFTSSRPAGASTGKRFTPRHDFSSERPSRPPARSERSREDRPSEQRRSAGAARPRFGGPREGSPRTFAARPDRRIGDRPARPRSDSAFPPRKSYGSADASRGGNSLDRGERRPPFRSPEGSRGRGDGWKPAQRSEGSREARPSSDRPERRPRSAAPPREGARPFAGKRDDARAAGRSDSKPAFRRFDQPRGSGAPPFKKSAQGSSDGRPARAADGEKRAPWRPRGEGASPRKPFAAKGAGDRPSGPPRPFGKKFDDRDKRPYARDRQSGARGPQRDRPERPSRDSRPFTARPADGRSRGPAKPGRFKESKPPWVKRTSTRTPSEPKDEA